MKSLNGDRAAGVFNVLENVAQYSGKRTESIDETLISKENSGSSIIPEERREKFETRIANLRAVPLAESSRELLISRLVYIFTVTENVAAVSRWLLSIVERFSEDKSGSNVAERESSLGKKEPVRATTCYFVDERKRRNTESWLLPRDRSPMADNELQGTLGAVRSILPTLFFFFFSLSKAIVAIDTDRLSRMKTIQQKTCMSRD